MRSPTATQGVDDAQAALAPHAAKTRRLRTKDFATIQQAIDGVADGGEVCVAPGSYSESVDLDDIASGSSRWMRWIWGVPLWPPEVATWGTRDGFLIPPTRRKTRVSPTPPITALWRLAGVPEAVWAPPEGRSKGNPHHAFRKGFKTGLGVLGVSQDIRDFLVGHHRGVDEVYVSLAGPARGAVERIPPLADDAAAGRVLAFPRSGTPE